MSNCTIYYELEDSYNWLFEEYDDIYLMKKVSIDELFVHIKLPYMRHYEYYDNRIYSSPSTNFQLTKIPYKHEWNPEKNTLIQKNYNMLYVYYRLVNLDGTELDMIVFPEKHYNGETIITEYGVLPDNCIVEAYHIPENANNVMN